MRKLWYVRLQKTTAKCKRKVWNLHVHGKAASASGTPNTILHPCLFQLQLLQGTSAWQRPPHQPVGFSGLDRVLLAGPGAAPRRGHVPASFYSLAALLFSGTVRCRRGKGRSSWKKHAPVRLHTCYGATCSSWGERWSRLILRCLLEWTFGFLKATKSLISTRCQIIRRNLSSPCT